MPPLPSKGTVRFTALLQSAGSPESATLWTAPEKDPDFRRAIRENRILSIQRENTGTQKDFGVVGFLQEKNVSYLIFPRPLTPFAGRRVVGIKFDRITSIPKGTPVKGGVSVLRPASPNSKTAKPKISNSTYSVRLRASAEREVTVRVTAPNLKLAQAEALKLPPVVQFEARDVRFTIVK